MEPHDVNVQNMRWRPSLVRLTQIHHPSKEGPDVPEGPAFCDPEDILCIRLSTVKFEHGAGIVSCTAVNMHCGVLNVVESPEEVARLRDEAFGHVKPKGPRAVP